MALTVHHKKRVRRLFSIIYTYDLYGASTSQVIGASNELFFMIMMAYDIPGRFVAYVFLTFVLRFRKTRKKPQPGKLTLTGIEPGPAM